MDEKEVRSIVRRIEKVEKRLDRDVAGMCRLLKVLAKEIEKRRGLPGHVADLLRKPFHDIYKSLKLHLVFHSGADLSRFDATKELQDLGVLIRLNDEELQTKPDENSALEYCADPWSTLLEFVSRHFRVMYKNFSHVQT